MGESGVLGFLLVLSVVESVLAVCGGKTVGVDASILTYRYLLRADSAAVALVKDGDPSVAAATFREVLAYFAPAVIPPSLLLRRRRTPRALGSRCCCSWTRCSPSRAAHRGELLVQSSRAPRAGAVWRGTSRSTCWWPLRPAQSRGHHHTRSCPFSARVCGIRRYRQPGMTTDHDLSRSITPLLPRECLDVLCTWPMAARDGAPSLTDNGGVLGRLAACLGGWMGHTCAVLPASGAGSAQWPWCLLINATCPRFPGLPYS